MIIVDDGDNCVLVVDETKPLVVAAFIVVLTMGLLLAPAIVMMKELQLKKCVCVCVCIKDA